MKWPTHRSATTVALYFTYGRHTGRPLQPHHPTFSQPYPTPTITSRKIYQTAHPIPQTSNHTPHISNLIPHSTPQINPPPMNNRIIATISTMPLRLTPPLFLLKAPNSMPSTAMGITIQFSQPRSGNSPTIIISSAIIPIILLIRYIISCFRFMRFLLLLFLLRSNHIIGKPIGRFGIRWRWCRNHNLIS